MGFVKTQSLRTVISLFADSEKYCRKNVKIAINNLNNHLVTAYSVNEKQIARENIQRRTRNNEV